MEDYERWFKANFPALTRYLRMSAKVGGGGDLMIEVAELKEGLRLAKVAVEGAADGIADTFIAGRNFEREYPEVSDEEAVERFRVLTRAGWKAAMRNPTGES